MKKVKLLIRGTVQNRKTLVRFYLIVGRATKMEVACIQFSGGNARRQILHKVDSLPYKEYLTKKEELEALYDVAGIKSFTDPKKRSTFKGNKIQGSERSKAYQREYRNEYRRTGGKVSIEFRNKLLLILNMQGREVLYDNNTFKYKKRSPEKKRIVDTPVLREDIVSGISPEHNQVLQQNSPSRNS